ncbi:MAG: HDOD domain-containing protein [Pirellulales bacterium]|nr:HDOD domain-containing protein [Pirellulales bacterium]MBX3432651.1 HDOD domain-containing protein [Pirellulales bacterium]
MSVLSPAVTLVVPSRSVKHQEALERLFTRVCELSALPGVAQRVLSVAGDEHADVEDLLHVVEQDPTLVIRILGSVNSAYRGLRQQVGDLRTAIALLGFREVRNLAITVYVARLTDSGEPYRNYSRTGLWRHLVAVGEVARVISKVCRRAEPEEAFLAGLLHDIGTLLIDQYMRPNWRRVLDMTDEGIEAIEAERHVLTFSRSDLSSYIAAKSLLPRRTCDAIAYHREPSQFRGKDRELLNVICLANYLTELRGLTAIGVPEAVPPGDDVYYGLGLRTEQMSELLQELEPALAAAEALAGI